MVANQGFTRVDTLELKGAIRRKIGNQRAEKYFDMLNRLFRRKIGKSEFNKYCMQLIGRDNLTLHNELILSMFKNARGTEVPPLSLRKVPVASSADAKGVNDNRVHSLESFYGESVPPSLRKGRSVATRDRKFRDRPSPLGPLGKTQHSATEVLSLGSRPPIEGVSVEDGEEVEQAAGSPSIQSRSPVTAPLGISMNKGVRKTLASGTQKKFPSLTCQKTCELPDARTLRSRVQQKLEEEGLGISVECANVLNNGLDCYLKRLIEPCIGLVGSRCLKERPQHITSQRNTGLNGMLPANGRFSQKPCNSITASLVDFSVVMESNPSILGGDWAVLLEKVCFSAFEE